MKPKTVLLVAASLAASATGCGDDSSEDEAVEQARIYHETRNLMDDIIGETLFRIPEERDRLIQLEEDYGYDVTGAGTDFDTFMTLRQVGNRIDGIRRELEASGQYLPDIDLQYR
jgi:hypothetical protein